MRVVLHIGAEKTGTTSIQRFFHVNRKALKKASIFYSKAAGPENHMALSAAAQSDTKSDDLRAIYGLDAPDKVRRFRVKLQEELAREAERAACATVVYSGEHCSSRLVLLTEIESLAAMLRPISEDISIVVYLRRQDDFLCSTYSTDVKSGFAGAFIIPHSALQEQRYDYLQLLQRWASVFGKKNIICRVFEPSKLKNSDVVDDFAGIVDLEITAEYRRPPRANESLDVKSLEFLRMFNCTLPAGNARARIRANIVHLLQETSKGPSPTLPEAELEAFMAHFRRSNGMVAEDYFEGPLSEIGDPLFGVRSGQKSRSEMKPIDAQTAVKFASLLWQRKQEQIYRLNAKIAELGRSMHEGGTEQETSAPGGKAAVPLPNGTEDFEEEDAKGLIPG